MSRNFILNGPFSEDEIKILHEKSVGIMGNTGVRLEDEKSLQIFADNGCKVEDNKVYIEKEMVEEALAQSPSSFVFKARNSHNNVEIGGGKPVMGPGLGIPFIIEDDDQRYSTFKDYIKLTKLIQSSEYFDLVGGDMVSPTDLDTASRHKDMFRAAARYSDKCLIGMGSGSRKSQECLQMAEILLQTDDLENNPCLLILIGASSPLVYNADALETLRTYTNSCQPVAIYSQILSGMTGPAAIPGTLILQNAEILTGVVLTQLINAGSPVIYGTFSSVTDMNSGDINVGSPGCMQLLGGSVQMAKYYNLPSLVAGSLTNYTDIGFEAGFESMLNMFTASALGADIILFAAGLLKNYLGVSYKKFAYDLQILESLHEMQVDIKVDENTTAAEVISEIGVGGDYLTHSHTISQLNKINILTHSREERTAADIVNKMLKDYQKPDLDSEIEEKLQQA